MSAVLAVLDLFRGAGGWSIAAERLGLQDHGVENNRWANATAEAAGFMTSWEDVWGPPGDWVTHEYVGLIASPPCQTFSMAGKGKGREALDAVLALVPHVTSWTLAELREQGTAVTGDERTALVLTPLLYAEVLRPEWIALEQVPSVLPVWEAIGVELEKIGYSVETGILHSEQYGVPQTRKRAFLVASRTKVASLPVPTHSKYHNRSPERLDEGVAKWVSMAEALGWLPQDRSGHEATHMGDVYNSKGCIRSVTEPSPTMTASMDNGNFQWFSEDNPPTKTEARLAVKRVVESRVNNQSGTEFDLAWPMDRPAPTIAGRNIVTMPGANANRFNGATKSRNDGIRVTVQEAGVLQSFPADYPWTGTQEEVFLQAGNAVPPLLAEAVLRQVV